MEITLPKYKLTNMSGVRKYEVFAVNDKLLVKVQGLKAIDLDSRRTIKLLGSTPCLTGKYSVSYPVGEKSGKFKNLRLFDVFVSNSKSFIKLDEVNAIRLNYDGIVYPFCPNDDVKRVKEVKM